MKPTGPTLSSEQSTNTSICSNSSTNSTNLSSSSNSINANNLDQMMLTTVTNKPPKLADKPNGKPTSINNSNSRISINSSQDRNETQQTSNILEKVSNISSHEFITASARIQHFTPNHHQTLNNEKDLSLRMAENLYEQQQHQQYKFFYSQQHQPVSQNQAQQCVYKSNSSSLNHSFNTPVTPSTNSNPLNQISHQQHSNSNFLFPPPTSFAALASPTLLNSKTDFFRINSIVSPPSSANFFHSPTIKKPKPNDSKLCSGIKYLI